MDSFVQNITDMAASIASTILDMSPVVQQIRNINAELGNLFDGEQSDSESFSSTSSEAASAANDASDTLVTDQGKEAAQATTTAGAQKDAADATDAYNKTLTPLEQAQLDVQNAYSAYFAAIASGDKDAISAASSALASANKALQEAQKDTDDAENTMEDKNEVKDEEETKLDEAKQVVAEDEAAVEEANEEVSAQEEAGAELTSEVEATQEDVEQAAVEYTQEPQAQQADPSVAQSEDPSKDSSKDPLSLEGEENEKTPLDLEEEKQAIDKKIENNEVTDEKMAEVIIDDIFAGDVANTASEELLGLNAQKAIEVVNENLKAQSLYSNSVSTTMDTASIDENQEAISDFYTSYIDVQDRLSQNDVDFVSVADEANYSALSGIVQKLNASEYVMTAEIEKATATADSIEVEAVEVSESENKAAEIKGQALLKEFEAIISKDDNVKEDSSDDILTQKEYDDEENFFENAENKSTAYSRLVKDAEQYNIFALAA